MVHDSNKALKIQQRLRRISRPNDKLADVVASLSADEYAAMIANNLPFDAVDAARKNREYYTRFWLEHVGEHCDLKPLSEYDKDVLTACISFFEGGFDDVTPDMIFRLMTGSKRIHARPEQRAAILASVDKMMCTRIRIDMSATCKKYRDRVSKAELVAPILPCKRLSVKVNGKQADVIHFFEESPLMTVARAKKQVLTFDATALAVPNLNNTQRVTEIKFYVVERVHEIIAHKMTPTITFADVLNRCGLSDATKRQRQDVRTVIREIMSHIKQTNTIRYWCEYKKGDKYHGINFVYD